MALNLWKPPKRATSNPRRPVVPGVCLSRYTNHELGVRIARHTGQPRQEPGIAWARLMHGANRPAKDAARDAVLAQLTVALFPTLNVLTFPASEWRFERALLALRREPLDHGPRHTKIVALERDIAIYRAACHNIPRSKSYRRHREEVRTIDCPAYASASVQTSHVMRFNCCTFEDYANDSPRGVFDAAWLDFTGKLTPSRLTALARFWERQVRALLVVTLYNGRTDSNTTARIERAGGVGPLLAAHMPGAALGDVRDYGDGAPMVQMMLHRVSGVPAVVAQYPHIHTPTRTPNG